MIIVKLKCTKDIREKFKKYDIDRKKLENYLIFITNNLVNTRKWWVYEVTVKGCKGVDSQYFWGEDEIEVALNCTGCTTKNERKMYFMKSLVHEYRHWVQSQIQNVPGSRLDYTEQDINERNEKYTGNKYEIECAEWEELIERFIDMV